MLTKKEQRLRRARQTRIRIATQGVARLTVNRTNLHIYASVISGDGGKVIACASTAEAEVRTALGAAGKGGNVAAALARRRQGEVGGPHGREFDLDIEPVEQGPRDAALIIGRTAQAGAAGVTRFSGQPAPARVHCGNQLEARRIGDVIVDARDHRSTALQRLAQAFEHAWLKFGKLVEKQHAVVGE